MSKPPTIHDVADALGMHKSTVSLALSGKGNVSMATRARVLAVAREMGYEPNPLAQRLATGLGNSLVCIFSGVLDVGLATEKILLIQKALNAQALEVPIYTCYESAREPGKVQAAQVKQLCRQRPRAIVCASQMVEPEVFAELDAYQRQGGIVVCYDIPVPLDCDQVIFDRENNAYQAARYLLECGHRHIGIGLSYTPGRSLETPSTPHSFRLKGFRRALEAFGAPLREDWLFLNTTYEKGGAEMARHFLSLRERPTGLCIVNDYVALAFMAEVIRAGVRIPEDVSIVGHDNQPIAAYCPVPLTSVTQPTDQIAHAVAQALRARLDDREGAPPRRTIISSELVLRDSVGPPPA